MRARANRPRRLRMRKLASCAVWGVVAGLLVALGIVSLWPCL